VVFTYFRRRDAAGEYGRLAQAERGRLPLQGRALRPVADDQRPHRQAALPEQFGRLEQRADALVRDQAGDHAYHMLVRPDGQRFPQFRGVGQRCEELIGDGVRHDEDLLGGDAAGHDLLFHGLAERDHKVGRQHGLGLEVAVAPVQFAMGEFGGVRVAGQPRVFPEPAHLVDDRRPVPLPQGQRDRGVLVVARRVEDRGAEPCGQPRGLPEPSVLRFVRPGGYVPREQAVVGNAVQRDQAPAVDHALGYGVTGSGYHVRVEAVGPLGHGDLVRSYGVPGAGGGQRVVDQVQDAAGGRAELGGVLMIVGRNGRYLPRTGRDRGFQPSARAARRPLQGLEGLGDAAFAPGQAGGQDRPGAVVFGQPAQCRCRDRGLIDGQAERGQAPGRGLESRLGFIPVPGAPQQGRPPVRAGKPQASAQPVWQYSLGENQCADRVGGRVPPGDRRRERERSGRHVRAVEAVAQADVEAVVQAVVEAGALGPRPTRGGRHHGR
jgi:hypothetical protein